MAQLTQDATPQAAPRRNRNLFPKAGAWKMFGLRALFLLPVAGLIAAVVFSFVPVNPNLKSLARSELLMQLVYALLFVVAFSLFMSFVYPALVTLTNTMTSLSTALEQIENIDPSILEAAQSYGIDISALEGLNSSALQSLLPLVTGLGG